MKIYGLIGYPLGHSFSKKYFTEKFAGEGISNAAYELFPIEEINLLPELIKNNEELIGLNVTIPYKEQVLPYIHEFDNTAESIQAVNCIKIIRNNKDILLRGYNTDAYGFETALKPLLENHHKKALIFGTGGASKAVEFVLRKLNIEYKYVSRTPRQNIIGYRDIDKDVLHEYSILINTSPLGMHPNLDSAPDIPYEVLTDQHLLYDLVYNPEETKFMKLGMKNGAKAENGLKMLYGQAEKAWEIWNG